MRRHVTWQCPFPHPPPSAPRNNALHLATQCGNYEATPRRGPLGQGMAVTALTAASITASAAQVCAQLRSACDREERGGGAGRGGGLTAASVARELAVTLSVAQEQLLLAEHKGALCRDEGPDGLRFFANRFSEFLAAAPRLRPTAVEAL